MTFYVYGLKNRLLGSFESPISSNIESKDYLEGLALSLVSSDIAVLSRYQEYDLYLIATFDSISGEIKSCFEFVSSLEPLCIKLIEHIKAKGVAEDGTKRSEDDGN